MSAAGAQSGAELDAADTIGEERDEPTRAIDVVMRAALARDALSGPGRVPLAWVASLIGVTCAHMRVLAAREKMDVVDGRASCAEMRRWLEARGVPGIGRRGRAVAHARK